MNCFEKAENVKFREFSMTSLAKLLLCCFFLSLHVVQSASQMEPKSFAAECLAAHNEYRAKHNVPPLKLNEEISQVSKRWADHLVKIQGLEHTENSIYGENLFMSSSSDPNFVVDGKKPVDDWYGEIKDYDFKAGSFSFGTGHFTQVVWKESKELGVGFSKSGGIIAVVCNYAPPGNVQGQFIENVPPVDPSKAGARNLLTPGETYFGTTCSTQLKIICVILNTVFIFLVNMLQRI